MSIRTQLVEAGAEVLERDRYQNWSGRKNIHEIVAENLLDAMLDVLAGMQTELEIREAIPPTYTKFIGEQFLAQIGVSA